MGIGYNHAARLIDLLEDRGVIGPAKSAGPRDILIDLDAPMETVTPSPSGAPEETDMAEPVDTVTHEFDISPESEQTNQNGGNP